MSKRREQRPLKDADSTGSEGKRAGRFRRWLSSFRHVSMDALRPDCGNSPSDSADAIPRLPAWLKWTFLALAVVKLALVAVLPVQAWPNAIYDDALMVRASCHLAQGHWLGPYDQLTLAKGPMFPIFLTACHFAGLPLRMGEQLLYIGFCAAMIWAVRPLGMRPWLLVVLYCALIFDPICMASEAFRPLREHTYTGFTGMVFSCAFAIVLRRHLPLRVTFAWAVVMGVCLTCVWLTREEGIWIFPSLAILLAWAGWTVARRHPRPGWWFVAASVPFVMCAIGNGAVCAINYCVYGVAAVSEFKEPNFLAAYGSLTRIEQAQFRRCVPVPREVRQRAYAVSPAFRELQPFLEGSVGRNFAMYSKEAEPDFDFEGEIGGGHMLWAIRDAVACAGHGRTAKDAAQYFSQVAREVNDACDRGLVPAGPRRASLMPPWDWRYMPHFWHALLVGGRNLVCMNGMDLTVGPSVGDEASLAPFREMTRSALSPTQPPLVRVSGLAFSPLSPSLELQVVTADRSALPCTVSWQDSSAVYWQIKSRGPDIPGARRAAFSLTFPNVAQSAKLVIAGEGKQLAEVPLDGQGRRVDTPSLQAQVGPVASDSLALTECKDLRLGTLQMLVRVYQAAIPLLAIFGLVGFALQWAGWFAGRRSILLLFSTALLCAVVTRLALAALVTATCFTATSIRLLIVAHPLLVAFCVFSLAGGWPAAADFWRRLPVLEERP